MSFEGNMHKIKLYHNRNKPAGLMRLVPPGDANLYGMAQYSNEVLMQYNQLLVKNEDGYQVVIDSDELELNHDDGYVYLDTRHFGELDETAQFQFKDIVNDVQLTWFIIIDTDTGKLPWWVSNVYKSVLFDDFSVVKLQAKWDYQNKRRLIDVWNIPDTDVYEEKRKYESQQSEYDLAKIGEAQAKKFRITDEEEELLRRVKKTMAGMNMDSITADKLSITLTGWGVDSKRADWIARNLDLSDVDINVE